MTQESPSAADFSADGFLKDGSAVRLRAIRPDDGERLVGLADRSSDETLYYRFFTPPPLPFNEERLNHLTHIDYDRRMAVVAVLGEAGDERIVAVGRWDADPDDPSVAEVAFLVEDAFQGLGLGTLLLRTLADLAPAHGIAVFDANVLAENRPMLAVFHKSGYRVTHEIEYGTYHLEFPIHPTHESIEAAAAYQRSTLAATLKAVLEPRRIAIIGAGRDPGSLGASMLRNVVHDRFTGSVHPVNPNADSILSIPTVASIGDLGGDVDLAVISVPKEHVLEVVGECGKHGVKAVLVVSSGWDRPGGPDTAELVGQCRAYGMRLVGPSSMGIVNSDPLVRLNLTIGDTDPLPGVVGIASQSGALGIGLLEYLHHLNLGVSQFVSLGDRTDVSSNDLLAYWYADEPTRVICLYLESFGNARTFGTLARLVGRSKPIAVTWSGDEAAGVGSTGLLRQVGLIRARTLEELVDVAALLSTQPLPEGNRVAIVSNAGGAARLAASACRAAGLVEAQLSPETVVVLDDLATTSHNPVELPFATDMGALYGRALAAVASDPAVDCVLALYVPLRRGETDEVARVVLDASQRHPSVTFAACSMSVRGTPPLLRRGRVAVPAYPFPETAAQVLGHAARYSHWRSRPMGLYPSLSEDVLAEVQAGLDTLAPGRVHGDAARVLLAVIGLEMASGSTTGVSYVVTLHTDARFGTIIGLGEGFSGTRIGDEDHRVVPITDVDADELVSQVVADDDDAGREVLAPMLLTLSALADAVPRIAGADIELVRSVDGVFVVDAVLTLH